MNSLISIGVTFEMIQYYKTAGVIYAPLTKKYRLEISYGKDIVFLPVKWKYFKFEHSNKQYLELLLAMFLQYRRQFEQIKFIKRHLKEEVNENDWSILSWKRNQIQSKEN